MLLLLSHMAGCSPDLADSGPVYPGWALEQSTSGVDAGEVRTGLVVTLEGEPCVECVVIHEAELAVEVHASQDVTASIGSASGAPLVERNISAGSSGLLVVPLFEECTSAPTCTQGVELRVLGEGDVRWRATARSTSTHDAELWAPQAALTLR